MGADCSEVNAPTLPHPAREEYADEREGTGNLVGLFPPEAANRLLKKLKGITRRNRGVG